MRFIKNQGFGAANHTIRAFPKRSTLQPVLPLVPEVLPTIEQDKSKFVTFELKVRAGQPVGSTMYKKFVRVFEEGTPQQWIELVGAIQEIWTQNSVNGPTDRTATIRSLLKGESLTAFDTALEDVRVDPNQPALLPLSNEQIELALGQVAVTVFPHRALEIQRLWMHRGMKKPYDMSTRKTAAAITKINNALPLFPNGNQDSKFSEQELVGLLEWSLPQAWRKKFDLDGYIPTLDTKAKLITECEAIERNESLKNQEERNDNNNKNKKNKKTKFEIRRGSTRISERPLFRYFCRHCGRNRSHNTGDCYFLKKTTQRTTTHDDGAEEGGKKIARPFSRRTFRKEVNALARKTGKKKALGLYAAAIKREQGKESKKMEGKKGNEAEDSSASSDSMSVNMVEKISLRDEEDEKDTGNGKKGKQVKDHVPTSVSMNLDEEFLEKVAKMNIEDEEFEMLEDEEYDNNWEEEASL
jgi:hypothetical protein